MTAKRQKLQIFTIQSLREGICTETPTQTLQSTTRDGDLLFRSMVVIHLFHDHSAELRKVVRWLWTVITNADASPTRLSAFPCIQEATRTERQRGREIERKRGRNN